MFLLFSFQAKVYLMAQGITHKAAWSIAEGGFGVIANENDPGWFGKGIYFSSLAKYTFKYAVKSASEMTPPSRPAMLICATTPGNVLPVTDMSYYGKPVANGYQAHFTIGGSPLIFCIVL